MLSKEERELLRKLGQRTGAQGGLKAAANMTADERRVRATKASRAAAKARKEARHGKR